jgi:HD-like signal output (HDOD) protein
VIAKLDCRGSAEEMISISIERLKSLGILPTVAIEIMKMMDDESSSAAEVESAIQSDPSLLAQVLRVVNSSFYGLPRQVASVKQAVVLLGRNVIKSIAIASTVNRLYRKGRTFEGLNPKDLWLHAIAVGCTAREIARQTGEACPEEAFAAGMLHDVGVILEFQIFPREFEQILRTYREAPDETYREAERACIGTTHEELGGSLCRRWNFPETIEFTSAFHHRPWDAPESVRTMPSIVHVADAIVDQLSEVHSLTVEVGSPSPNVMEFLGVTTHQFNDIKERVPDAIQEFAQILA